MPQGEGPGCGESQGRRETQGPGTGPGPEKVFQGTRLQISVLLCQNHLGERDKTELAHRWIFPSFCVLTLRNISNTENNTQCVVECVCARMSVVENNNNMHTEGPTTRLKGLKIGDASEAPCVLFQSHFLPLLPLQDNYCPKYFHSVCTVLRG